MAKKNYKKLAKASVASTNIVASVATAPAEESKVSLPPTIKPDDIIGKTIGGTIYGVHEFKGKGFKGKIIQMRHENGTAFGFPLCASVRYGLANFLGVED
ncbi:hypothetical protein L0244_19610, partial [bacterium]|nr:hypothetical protein [bacterium]